jgi:ATP/maltotriose-dependent transcriptional regulator MalT
MAAQDFESMLREVLGDSWNKLTQFQSDQVKKLTTRFSELTHEAMKDELARLHADLNDLRARVAALEAERAEKAAESVLPSS